MSNAVNPVKAELEMKKIYFDRIDYRRDVIDPHELNYQINFKREICKHDDDTYTVSLLCNIAESKNQSIELHIRIVGYFRCVCDDENMRKTLVKKNTVAILFPYLRSHITLVTTQPDMPPIVLPPMNVAEMFKDDD